MVFEKPVYTREDEIAFLNFFINHQEFTSVKVQLLKTFDKEILKSVIFQILDYCSKLRELHFCNRFNWLTHLTTSELSHLSSKTKNLKKFSLKGFNIKGSTLYAETWFTPTDTSDSLSRNFLCMIKHFVHLQCLYVDESLSDEFLQMVFQHMVRIREFPCFVYCRSNLELRIFPNYCRQP